MGSYNQQGVYAAANKPGARAAANGWKDLNGDLWLFGGWAFFPGGRMPGNDLWKYSFSLNQWVWMKGDTLGNQIGVYNAGTSSANKPGPRGGPGTWIDASGNFYLAGGYGLAANSVVGYLSDLWKISSTSLNQATTTAMSNLGFEKEFSIGPNPVTDVLRIHNRSLHDFRVHITDITGRTVATSHFTGSGEISFSQLPAGNYHVMITDAKTGKSWVRMVVKR
jgi:hypothetical protein